jgi:hypothetical protein
MSMVAVFACEVCGTESIHGRFKGDEMYHAAFQCKRCQKRTAHKFTRYSSEELVPEGVRKSSARQS